jgi:hypothetical protein
VVSFLYWDICPPFILLNTTIHSSPVCSRKKLMSLHLTGFGTSFPLLHLMQVNSDIPGVSLLQIPYKHTFLFAANI